MSISRAYTLGDTEEAIKRREETHDRIFGRKIVTSSGIQYTVFLDEGEITMIQDRDGVIENLPIADLEEIEDEIYSEG